jgi:biopolymer transport protein ExbD
MSDVAFLLLVFFLSTTIFDFEVGIPMVLPGVQASPVTVERRNVLTIHTDAGGAITIDLVPVIPAQIEGIVRERLALNPELIIKIETAPAASYEMMIQVLDRVRLAKATRISLRLGGSA